LIATSFSRVVPRINCIGFAVVSTKTMFSYPDLDQL
jgi:hypothetical protein